MLMPVPHHGVIDVSVSEDEGARQYVGRCRCGWESDACQNGVHAVALVEDHAEAVRARARRGLFRSAS